jgi:thiol-disulfide isomerase/thioredoxin
VNRKILIFFISGLLLSGNIKAQIYWLHNFDLARSIANSSERLIIIDFWASWCGPCKVMDIELWQNAGMQKISKNFIGVRIDVDTERSLTARYGVKSIPKVIIITAGGDIIWQQDGYDYAEHFLQIFEAIPDNVGELNKNSRMLTVNKNDLQANYSVGLEFQRLGRINMNNELRNSFLNCSELYLRKALKLCNDTLLAEEIELKSIMNDIYSGRHEKALKMIEKMDSVPGNESTAELKHFILAKCYKNINDQDNYQKEKQMVTKKELLDQLEN